MLQQHFKNKLIELKNAGLSAMLHLDEIFPEHHEALYEGINKNIFGYENGYLLLQIKGVK